jgi:hypothetical protein
MIHNTAIINSDDARLPRRHFAAHDSHGHATEFLRNFRQFGRAFSKTFASPASCVFPDLIILTILDEEHKWNRSMQKRSSVRGFLFSEKNLIRKGECHA